MWARAGQPARGAVFSFRIKLLSKGLGNRWSQLSVVCGSGIWKPHVSWESWRRQGWQVLLLSLSFPWWKMWRVLPLPPESYLCSHGDHKQPSALRSGSSKQKTLVSLYSSSFFPVTMTSEHGSGHRVSGPTSTPFCHQEGMPRLSHVPIYTELRGLEEASLKPFFLYPWLSHPCRSCWFPTPKAASLRPSLSQYLWETHFHLRVKPWGAVQG